MKSQMGALDIKAAVQECQPLIRGRITKVLAGKSAIGLAVHSAERGKVWVVARIPGFLYSSGEKPEIGSPSPFQAALKKHVEGLKLESIVQHGFERAVSIKCVGTEDRAEIAIELFSPGNAVLIKGGAILTALKRPDARGSRHASGAVYVLPKGKASAWEMGEGEIAAILTSSSEAASLVLGKSGLGQLWAKEACLRAGADPSKPASPKEAKAIAAAVCGMARERIDPRKVFEGGRILDVTPFALMSYGDLPQEKTSMGEGVRAMLSQSAVRRSSYSDRIEKAGRIIEKQRSHLIELEEEVSMNSRCGELIYENYQLVSQLLDGIRKARETLSWKEIKARLKDHKVVKEIDEAKGDITIEI